jgi:hypothetical protein
LLTFAFLAGVRAPLGNAPAAGLVALLVGVYLAKGRLPRTSTPSLGTRLKLLVCGGVLLWFGVGQLGSQMTGASVQSLNRELLLKQAAGTEVTAAELQELVRRVRVPLRFRPHDPNFGILQVQWAMQLGQQAARTHMDALLKIAPFDVLVGFTHIDLLRSEGDPGAAYSMNVWVLPTHVTEP